MKQWQVISKSSIPQTTSYHEQVEAIRKILLENRNLTKQGEIDSFLYPSLASVTTASVAIDKKQLKKAIERIDKAITNKEQIVVFGDYDVDGITGTAIIWEELHKLGAVVSPYIPHRVDEGYGLSTKGVLNVKSQLPEVSLIITVDNGIVANEAVTFAKEQGIDVIITDHHTIGEELPSAYAIVHTTKLCGAGVGYLFVREFASTKGTFDETTYLDLVVLATVADLVPLTGANRTLLQAGLPFLRQTKRVGLQELYQEAGIDSATIDVYTIGHMIAPRLNAMGRLESAMDSLRLLCTNNKDRAQKLAHLLGQTNRGRQLLTQSAGLHAIEQFKIQENKLKKLLFIANGMYEEGIIGLVAGKLVEEFYRPAIVISKGEKVSKASARSVAGFNIIEFIRSASDLLINAGGHPMAAGFTVANENILLLQEALENLAEKQVTDEHLVRTLKIDMELPLKLITVDLYTSIQQLAPFGMGNPEPTFVSKEVKIADIKIIGKGKNHVKLACYIEEAGSVIDAIGFNLAEKMHGKKVGDTIDIAYTVDENEWNGRKKLQLKIRDIR